MSESPTPPRRPRLRSLLAPWQKALLGVAAVVAVFVLANTAYLLLNHLADAAGWSFFAVGRTSLPELYQVMILAHTGAGLLLAVLGLAFFVTHLPTVWRRRHRESVVSGIVVVVAGAVLVVTGLFILTAAASEANRWAWWAHVGAAALVPLGYALHRLTSYARPPRRRARRFGLAVLGVVVVLVAWHGATKRGIELTPETRRAREAGLGSGPGSRAGSVEGRSVGGRLGPPFVPAGFVSPASPFFPSPVTTTSGDFIPPRILTGRVSDSTAAAVSREVEENGFAAGTPVGAETCARCHADVAAQWASSAHRFASFNNPFYEATVREMRATADEPNRWVTEHAAAFAERVDGVARAKSQWCAGCHDPVVLLSGEMGGSVDRATVSAQAGLTCLTCHRIDTLHGPTGNGNYNIADDQEDPYLFADAPPGTLGALLHDAALRARPAVHRRRMLRPFFRESEYCATCHKVSLSEPVNGYRWLRGQNEYDAWHDSGISLNASRTFYLPGAARECQDCHMPREPAPLGDVAAEGGTVRSHRFLGANTALPYVRGDTATVRRTEAFLRDGRLRVDVFALRRSTGGDGEELLAPLDGERLPLVPGERVIVDVVVRNLDVGHTFPGGTNDSNEGWLEVSVLDGDGSPLARSGALGPDGHLDPTAHAYKAVILDGEGRPIQRRNAHDIHVTAAVNVIGPGAADVGHYELVVPDAVPGGRIVVRARLLWRKFDRAYTEFAFEANPGGFRHFERVPDLPVTEIAADEVTLPLRPRGGDAGGSGSSGPEGSARRTGVEAEGGAGEGRAPDEGAAEESGAEERAPEEGAAGGRTPLWVRFNDYGIGLLLEGNTRLARRAFERVAALEPERIDGPLNLARVAVLDGDLDAAYEHLERVEGIRAGDARAAWVWGQVLRDDGRYRDAALAYRRVLRDFPEDRAAWRDLGRVLFLDQRYDEALEALGRVLAIDPEDRAAHYFRMLALRASGREAEAAGAAFEYYRVDESAQALTRAYRQENPGVNLMAQPIHTHELGRIPADAGRGGDGR